MGRPDDCRSLCYVAFKCRHPAVAAAPDARRHISADATLRTKCGAPHLVRESRTPGSEGEVPGDRHLYLPDKCGDEWFPLSQAVVAYDHPRHALLGDVITLDFIKTDLDPGARARIELTLETAKELRSALDRAIIAAELEEA